MNNNGWNKNALVNFLLQDKDLSIKYSLKGKTEKEIDFIHEIGFHILVFALQKYSTKYSTENVAYRPEKLGIKDLKDLRDIFWGLYSYLDEGIWRKESNE
jgi:hypothetical protein